MGTGALGTGGLIDRKSVALFVPAGLKKFKLKLFEDIGRTIGRTVRSVHELEKLPAHITPIVGCTPALRPLIEKWQREGRRWIYWDRGYLRRVFATWLPNGANLGIAGGYYRWHINRPQMGEIFDVPDDRWKALKLDREVKPWNKNGRHILIADTLPDYWNLFADPQWTKRTVERLKGLTDRPIIVRDKESRVPLYDELRDAHALVAHGSIAAVESVVMGCPVYVEPLSAAALVGQTDLSQIDHPIFPDRTRWLHSLAYCQFTEKELVDGTLWRLIR